MFSEINQKLFELKDKIRISNKNKAALNEIIELIKTEEAKHNYLKASLEKEHRDVEKLEGLSIAGIFHSILGNKEEQYEKEKKEYLEAKLKFDNCVSTLNVLIGEKAKLENEINLSGNLNKEYDSLLLEKEKLISSSDNSNKIKINELYEKISAGRLSLKEVDEAVSAGEDLQHNLNNIIDSLKSAQGWGTWDLLGGGIIATAVKHGKIDDARSQIAFVQVKLNRFSKELKDTGFNNSMSIDIGGFETFADYFFDNLITDWMVQSKINNSLEQTSQVYYKVQSIISDLGDKKCRIEAGILEDENKRKNLIENC